MKLWGKVEYCKGSTTTHITQMK